MRERNFFLDKNRQFVYKNINYPGVERRSVRRYIFTLSNCILFIVALAFLTQCATKPEVKKPDEQQVLRERIEGYWQERINGKIELAYQYEYPAYREKTSILQYANPFRLVRYKEAKISELEVEEGRAKAQVLITFVMNAVKLRQKQLQKVEEETWVKDKGVWYHVPQEFLEQSKK